MRWHELSDEHCSMARALSVVGDRWTLLILRNCFLGHTRFEQLQQQLGITRHRLSNGLKKLVEHGVLYKEPYAKNRYEYKLTEKGLDLLPVLLAFTTWGDKWLADELGPPMYYLHKECGHQTTPTMTCSHCQGILTTDNTRLKPSLKQPASEKSSDQLPPL